MELNSELDRCNKKYLRLAKLNEKKTAKIKKLKEALQGSHDLLALCLDDVKCDANLWYEVQEANKQALK